MIPKARLNRCFPGRTLDVCFSERTETFVLVCFGETPHFKIKECSGIGSLGVNQRSPRQEENLLARGLFV